jgi:hypothetical protein
MAAEFPRNRNRIDNSLPAAVDQTEVRKATALVG